MFDVASVVKSAVDIFSSVDRDDASVVYCGDVISLVELFVVVVSLTVSSVVKAADVDVVCFQELKLWNNEIQDFRRRLLRLGWKATSRASLAPMAGALVASV